MFDKDLWQEIMGALKKNKARTLLTAFGVFWGILMLIIMLGAGKGLHNGVTKGMGDFATNSFFIWQKRTSIPYKGFPSGRWIRFNNADVRCLRDNFKDILYMAPKLNVEFWRGEGQNVIMYRQKSGSFEVSGEYPEIFKIDPRIVLQGRTINYLDLTQTRKVAVIGKTVVDGLFDKGENPVGQYVKIYGMYFMVIGTVESKHNGSDGEEQNRSVILPFTTMQQTYNFGNRVHEIAITAKEGTSVSLLEDNVITILKKRHDISPDDKQAIGNYNLEKEVAQMNGLFMGINILIWIVGIGTLLAGIIGVSNIMLVIIRERTREIGIQRAIGATPLKIMGQIILESVFLTTVAGYTGLVLGVSIVEGVNLMLVKSGAKTGMFSNPEIDFGVAIAALTILIISGVFAGLIPAKRALSIKPVDALRYE